MSVMSVMSDDSDFDFDFDSDFEEKEVSPPTKILVVGRNSDCKNTPTKYTLLKHTPTMYVILGVVVGGLFMLFKNSNGQ